MKPFWPTLEGFWMALEGRPEVRLLFAAALAAVSFGIFMPKALVFVPNPMLPMLVMRMTMTIMLTYSLLTVGASLAYWYCVIRRWCAQRAATEPFLRRLPNCFDLLCKLLVRNLISSFTWRQAIIVCFLAVVFAGGIFMHGLALKILAGG